MNPKEINFSHALLKQIKRSPLRALIMKEEKIESTPAQKFALAVEVAIQERERFFAEYCPYIPPKGKTANRGSNHWKEKEAIVGEGKLLKFDQWEKIIKILESFDKNGSLKFIYSDGVPQKKLEWEKNGVRCKGYPDFISDAIPAIVDIKCVNRAYDSAVIPLIFKDDNLWHVQQAMYRAGAAANNIEVENSLLVFVEIEPPYLINCIELTDHQIHLGFLEYEKYLEVWRKSLETGEFKGYSKGFHQVETPNYYLKQFEHI